MTARVSRPPETGLVGQSPGAQALRAQIESAARSDATVLIAGEVGVDKHVVSRAIHHMSERAPAGLVTLDCAGLPDNLLESELFGHVRGSFPGAYSDKPGLLEGAPNGTVFLDNVGELSARMQGVLLRFLESGDIQRVGAENSRTRVNVRLITASSRDLKTQVTTGGFCRDLHSRLNVIRISIPPLRARTEDVPLLVNHYIINFSQTHSVPAAAVTSEAMDALGAYPWPGNNRELRQIVERCLLKTLGRPITTEDLPPEIVPTRPPALARDAPARSHNFDDDLSRRPPGFGVGEGITHVGAVFHQPRDSSQWSAIGLHEKVLITGLVLESRTSEAK